MANSLNDIFYITFWVTFYIAFLIVFTIGTIMFLFFRMRKSYYKRNQYNLTFLQIKLPSSDETEIEVAENMFTSIYGYARSPFQSLRKGQYRISFEIVAKKDRIEFFVVVPNELVNALEKQINAAYPKAEIDIIDPNEVWDRGAFTAQAQLKLSGKAFFPLKTYKDIEKTDPLNAITNSMSKLAQDEVVALQYIIAPAGKFWRTAGSSFIASVKRKSTDEKKGSSVDTSIIEGVEKKIKKPGFFTTIRLVCIADNKVSAETHLFNVAASFEQFADVTYSKFSLKTPKRQNKFVNDFIFRRITTRKILIPILDIILYQSNAILNTEEFASIFHFPSEKVNTPNIKWLGAKKSGPPSKLPEEGLYLGKNKFRGEEKKIFMKDADRTRHFYIIGQTGTGKSELMKSLALQDIKNNRGVAFIDPHGSAIDDILKKIPQERVEDVILWDVADTERPMGLNLLEAPSKEQQNMIVNSFIELLYKMYDPNRTGIMGPRLERAIRNVMLTAMVDPDATMVDVLRLLIDNNYSKIFIDKIQDPIVKKYWTDEIAKTSDYHKSETLGYFASKFDRFVTDTALRNILGQPRSAFDVKEVMSQQKILLVDLSKGKIGEENSNFLGLILVPKILTAALDRANQYGKTDFPDFYLYVDEFQNFATPDFATILSEARKYKLNLTVAHQFVAQLTEEIKDAMFGNVGSMAVFRVGSEDAEFLEPQFEPKFTKGDILKNPIGNCYMKLLIDGHPSSPFSMYVDWDLISNEPTYPEIEQQIRHNSRMRYGRPVAEVEEYINNRAGNNDKPENKDPRKLVPF